MAAMTAQTGLVGPPEEPFVVSSEVVGREDDPPDLAARCDGLRAIAEGYRARSEQVGTPWGRWTLGVGSPDGRRRDWSFEDGIIEDRAWRQAVGRLPERGDNLMLHNGLFGGVRYGAPAIWYRGTEVRALSIDLKSPADTAAGLAAELVDALRESALVPGVLTGFVQVDSVPDPYRAVVTDVSRLADEAFDREVHGYYWAVLLTAGHLEALGGRRRVEQEAPCESVESLDTPGGPALLCQLTGSPLAATAEDYRRWSAFLAPVLRIGYPGYWEAVPGRAAYPMYGNLMRPTWVFEGEPVPFHVPGILDKGIDPQRAGLAVRRAETVLDPEERTCWLYLDPAEEPDRWLAPVAAVVRAWGLVGLHGRLARADGGAFQRLTGVGVDEDDNGREALMWQFEPSGCPLEIAVDRLVAVLDELAFVATWPDHGDPFRELVIE
jgi:hypothetical protein